MNTWLTPGLATMFLTALALPAAGLTSEHQQSSESICQAQLGSNIDAVINRPQFRRARWGILIQLLSSDEKNRASIINKDNTLYSHDAQHFFIPASNIKLLTTATALRQLGSAFRIRTSVYDTGAGSLRVVGRGDPSLTDVQLKDLAQQLKRQGVRYVRHLVVDDGYFQGDVINLSWEWEDIQADYGASVNSLILNQNAVKLTLSPQKLGQPLQVSWADAIAAKQWRVENDSVTAEAGTSATVTLSSVLGQSVLRIKGQLAVDAQPKSFGLAILNPAEYFLQHFRNVLEAEGIQVRRASVVNNMGTPGERELAAVESPPLSVLLVETNQQSNNLYAEALLRSLQASAFVKLDTMNGSSQRNNENFSSPRLPTPDSRLPIFKLGVDANNDSSQIGLNKVESTLTDLGVDPKSYVLADGSGVSRHNLVSPEAIAQTLKLMAHTPQAAVYRASLPTAGVSGTLQRRFLNTAAQGYLQAKTGTMSGVSALSGYLDVPSYQPVVFSIMVNQSDQSVTNLRGAIDEIILLLTRLRSC
ncbi:MAG TPA: D-alanyl-D-alanine carboxypeptidase/D-alanyl-D-alanine-endopeptidase [Cyanobacteria bacterium UBA8553]|nr:D-alanyl-D-alanine carboxypeptidase/D-alanyl-D-alanine-endopeptidase [Cyanobacteria bacterium UBA8553]